MIRWMKFFGALVLALGLGAAVQAATDDRVLLTVQVDGSDGETTFTRDQLQALGETSFETETIWTSGTQTFTGVSLKALIAHLGVSSGVMQARAINDYMVEVPLSDAVEGGPIIAYERNGKEMSVRSKGPLWIVYPYDSNPSYKTEAIYSRSIWQLEGIVLKQ